VCLNDLSLCGGEVNTARHGVLSRIRFLTMQAVMRSTSGMYSLHSRIASGWQACCCSGVPWLCARAVGAIGPTVRAKPRAAVAREAKENVCDLCPAVSISRPVPFGEAARPFLAEARAYAFNKMTAKSGRNRFASFARAESSGSLMGMTTDDTHVRWMNGGSAGGANA
jgi:hypothetical protein